MDSGQRRLALSRGASGGAAAGAEAAAADGVDPRLVEAVRVLRAEKPHLGRGASHKAVVAAFKAKHTASWEEVGAKELRAAVQVLDDEGAQFLTALADAAASPEAADAAVAADDEAAAVPTPVPRAALSSLSVNQSLSSPLVRGSDAAGPPVAVGASSKARATLDRVARARQANAARLSEAVAGDSPGVAIKPTI